MQAAPSVPGAITGLPLFVVSEHRLVGEAIAAALHGAGVDARVIDDPIRHWVSRPGDGARALLVCDLGDEDSLQWAGATLDALDVEAVVLTSAPQGPMWGAVLEAGASDVLSASLPLREVAGHLSGDDLPISSGERMALVNQWRRVEAGRRQALDLLATLTPRELQVLGMLHSGQSVTDIAEVLGNTVSTVRSQVRSIRQKLRVGSQLAAVAVFRAARRGAGAGHPAPTRLALVDERVPNRREMLDPRASGTPID